MPTGLSLHIGLDCVDENAYEGWRGELDGCVNDAKAMRKIAAAGGFKPLVGKDGILSNHSATSKNVFGAIDQAAATLKAGDVFLLTYAGHGLQWDDTDGDEDDGFDESWVLYDRVVIDDILGAKWSSFKPGVRVVFVSDSCHSATSARALSFRPRGAVPVRYRIVPEIVKQRLRSASKPSVATATARVRTKKVAATVVVLAACADYQVAQDGPHNGLFTATLVSKWETSRGKLGYKPLMDSVIKAMPSDETPQLSTFGAKDPSFLERPAFTIPAV